MARQQQNEAMTPASMTTAPRAPLAGITVLGLEQAIAAPLCTRHLADLGARVIKVEQPGSGDTARHYDGVVRGMGAHFTWLNHGKESAALDLTEPADLDVFAGLLERADVLVSNLAPGALDRLGLAPRALAERYPRLIVVDISGYGRGGPLDHRRAYDLLVQAEAGSCAITGLPGQPAKPGIPIADAAAIGNARLNGVSDLAGHPQLAARGRWQQADSPVGPVPALLPPALALGWAAVPGRVPALGADTEAIRAEVSGR